MRRVSIETARRGWLARHAGAVLIVGVVVAAVMYVGSSWLDRFDGLAGPEQGVLIRLERDGPRVNEDGGLERWLAGRAEVPDTTVQSALCVNGPFWMADETLNNVLMVSTSEPLIRAAELAQAGEFDLDLVRAVEIDLIGRSEREELGVVDLSAATLERFDQEELVEYLQARSRRPSPESMQRFVVFAVSTTTTLQYTYFVDLGAVDQAAINRFADEIYFGPSNSILLAGSDREIGQNRRDCDQLDLP